MNSFDPEGTLTPRKQPPNTGLTSKTKRIINLINNHGHDPREAIKLVTGNTSPARDTVRLVRQKAARYSLARPAMVKLAHNVVKNVLEGKTREVKQQKVDSKGIVVDYIETQAPTATNQLQAAAMVFDRVEPVINRNVNLTGDLKDFLPVDLEHFL